MKKGEMMIKHKKTVVRKEYFLNPDVEKVKDRMLNSEHLFQYDAKGFRNRMFMRALKMIYPKVNLEAVMLSGFVDDEDFIIRR